MALVSDVGAWLANVACSVLIIFANKVLMSKAGYAFNFAVTLSALHYLTSATVMQGYKATGYMTVTKSLPMRDLVLFCVVSNLSIVSLNVSLMLNTVGFYQICKLMTIPFVCVVEAVAYQRAFSRPVTLSIATVCVGVAVVTVTSIGVISMLGLCIALLSIVAAGSQQLLCGHIQRKNGMSSTEMLLYTAWPMGFSLIAIGPGLDYVVTSGSWVLHYPYTQAVYLTIAITCCLAVGVNVSQFMCLGRFSAVAYQVMGHTKTIAVLLGGAMFFNDPISFKTGCGMLLAVLGMAGYGICTHLESSKPKPADDPVKSPLISNMPQSSNGTVQLRAQKTVSGPVMSPNAAR